VDVAEVFTVPLGEATGVAEVGQVNVFVLARGLRSALGPAVA
jgi:hypothetical protein